MAYKKTSIISKENLIFNIIAYTFIILAATVCLIPFLLVLSGSFTLEQSIIKDGLRIFPKVFSFEAYKFIFLKPDTMVHAYLVTISITAIGSILALLMISMTAYVLQRKDFPFRSGFSFYFFFTTLFNGGLVPWYILMIRYLHMKDNYLSLIIPMLFNVFYMIIIRSFMSNIPLSITESAKIDGAGDFTIFVRLMLPLSKPVLAAIGLFIALNYWNDWFNAMLFIEEKNMMPLQYFLHDLISASAALNKMRSQLPPGAITSNPTESLKMAMTIVAIGPIILLYPFVQKYFVDGIMIGAVKG